MGESKSYILSDEERISLQRTLIEIYIDVSKVCKRYDLKIMLGGGSCLGAVRHKGFIPWDDDLDLNMPRKDYNILLNIFNIELGDKYDLVDPGKTKSGQRIFAKIMKKNTTFIEENTTINKNTPKGIFIDIFPIESLPDNKLLRNIKLFIINISTNLVNKISKYQLSNTKSKKATILVVGFLTSFMSYYKWFKIYNSFISSGKSSRFCTIPSGRKGVYGELQTTSTFFPLSRGKFEGIEVSLPNNYHKYLNNLYGDYMKLPPPDQRKTLHKIIKFSNEKNIDVG